MRMRPTLTSDMTPRQRDDAPKTEDQTRLIKEAIVSNPTFGPIVADFSSAALIALADCASRATFSLGEVIVKHGDSTSSMWIVGEGEVEILSEGKRESVLSSGMCFGELSSLNFPQRAFSVVALSDVLLWELRRECIVAMHAEPIKAKLVSHAVALGRTAFFKNQSDSFVQRVADTLREQTFSRGDYIFKQDDEADSLYLLMDGSLILELDGAEVTRLRANLSLGLSPSFGCNALTEFGKPRRRTISVRVASIKADVLVLDRQLFWRVLRCAEDPLFIGLTARKRWNRLRAFAKSSVRKRYEVHNEILGRVEHFSSLPVEVRNTLAHGLRKSVFLRDEYVFKEGDVANVCYVMLHGLVSVMIDGVEMSRMEADFETSKTPVIGIQALFGDARRKASIRVLSHRLEVLAIMQESYRAVADVNLLGRPSPRVLGLKKSDGLVIQYHPEDLVELGLLGNGGFGTVTLVKHRPTEYLFALKAVSKGYVIAQNMQDCIMNERNILRMVNSSFLIRAVAFFNSPQRLLVLTELALGGELYDVCEKNKLFGKKEECRFFLACVFAALEHLHSRQIVYRSLKSENVLLDESGYAKLKDFGFAKVILGRTTTVCGTPHYFAPELVMGMPYDVSVDWWALGVLLFELNTGTTPFEADEPQRMFAKIACGAAAMVFPPRSEIWPDLVVSLCAKISSERLPMRSGGANRIRLHEYYVKTRCEEEDFHWTSFYERSMKPPFLPEARCCESTRNFPQDVVIDPQTVDCSTWKDQWAQFEDRWGPAIWDDPEDDPRPSSSTASQDVDRTIDHTFTQLRPRRSIFPPPPRLKEPEWENTSSSMGDEVSKGTDDGYQGLSRGMPKTSPRVEMPISLGDVDEPEESIVEPEPEDGVSDDEEATDAEEGAQKISPMEMFSRRRTSSTTGKDGEDVQEAPLMKETQADTNDYMGEKLVYEPNQTESCSRGQRLGAAPTRILRDDEAHRNAQIPFITSTFVDMRKGMSLKLASGVVEAKRKTVDRLVLAPKTEHAPSDNEGDRSSFIYKPHSQELAEAMHVPVPPVREHSGLEIEDESQSLRHFENAPSPESPRKHTASNSGGYDFTAFKEAMSSRLQAAASMAFESKRSEAAASCHASVLSVGGAASEASNVDADRNSEQFPSRESTKEQSSSVRNPFITPTGSINERHVNTVPESPAIRTRAISGSVTASPLLTYRELQRQPISFPSGVSPYPAALERNSPMMSSRVIKFPYASPTSCPSSPQFRTRSLVQPDPSTPSGFNTARPPTMRPSSNMMPSPTLKNRIIAPGNSESMLSNRASKLASSTPSGNEPQSPQIRYRSITSEMSTSLLGTRGLREPPSAARPMQATNYLNSSTKPAATLTNMPSSIGSGGLQSQPSAAVRTLRAPRLSRQFPSQQQSAPTNIGQHSAGQLSTNSQQQMGALPIGSSQQSTPLLRPRSPLRSPAISHRNVSSTPMQFPRSPGTPQTLYSRNLRLPPSQSGDMTAAAIMAGLGHTTPRSTGMTKQVR